MYVRHLNTPLYFDSSIQMKRKILNPADDIRAGRRLFPSLIAILFPYLLLPKTWNKVITTRARTLEGATHHNAPFIEKLHSDWILLKMRHFDWLRLLESEPLLQHAS